MLKKIATVAALAACCFAAPAFAENAAMAPERKLDLTLQAPTSDRGFQDVIGVDTGRPAAAVILTDALYGGLAGAAIGAGVALINGNNYGRDIGIGAGIGIVAGGIIGAVSVAGSPGYRDTTRGFSEGTPAMTGPTVAYGNHF